MWRLVEKKQAEELPHFFAKSLDKLKIALQGQKLSQDEIAEYNSRMYVNRIKDVDEKIKVDSIQVVEALASLRYVFDRIERELLNEF